MSKLNYLPVSIFALVIACSSASAGDGAAPPYLAALEDAPAIELKTADNRTTYLRQGEFVQWGDHLSAANTAGIRLAFEDGSQILLAPTAVLTASFDRELGVPVVNLQQGEARFLIPPSAEGAGRLRFVVRTHAAFIGVKGTDFVVTLEDPAAKKDSAAAKDSVAPKDSAAAGESGGSRVPKVKLYTLSGTVEIAGDLAHLKSGGRRVAAGQMTWATHEGVGLARPFNRTEFVKDWQGRYLRMEKLWRTALQEHQSGQLQKPYLARQQQQENQRARERAIEEKRRRVVAEAVKAQKYEEARERAEAEKRRQQIEERRKWERANERRESKRYRGTF